MNSATITLFAFYVGSALLIVGASARLDPECTSCPSKNCTYDKRLACSCRNVQRIIEIVDEADREYFNVSLGFAVDDTGSMGSEIESVKSSIESVIRATAGIFDKFVVGSINDPYVQNVFESADATAMSQFVSRIHPHGGDDCPEMALSGIRDVAARVSIGSVIFVFTDASAKDLQLESTVGTLLKSKNIRLNVLATGSLCNAGGELTRLTNSTNGTIYVTPDRSYSSYVMNYIKNYAKYSIRFIRGMPTKLDDLKVIATQDCSCSTHIEKLICTPPAPSQEAEFKYSAEPSNSSNGIVFQLRVNYKLVCLFITAFLIALTAVF